MIDLNDLRKVTQEAVKNNKSIIAEKAQSIIDTIKYKVYANAKIGLSNAQIMVIDPGEISLNVLDLYSIKKENLIDVSKLVFEYCEKIGFKVTIQHKKNTYKIVVHW